MSVKGLFLRMANVDGAGVGEDANESLAVTADASQAVDEVESASGDVTDVETGIGDAEKAQAELGGVQDLLEESVESGEGITPREAAHVEARLEHVAALLGTTVSAMGLTFRRESFGGTTSRLAATKMRLEFVKEWGTKIWEAIKKGWQWLKDALVNLYAKITGNVEAVEKRLKDLEGRVNSIGGSAKKTNDKMKASAKAFSIGEKTDKSTVEKVIEDIIFGTGVVEGFGGLCDPNEIAKSKNPAEMATAVSGYLKSKFGTVINTLPKGSPDKAVGYGNLLGGQTMIVAIEERTIGANKLELAKVSFDKASDKVAEDYQAFEKGDLLSLVKTGLKMTARIKEFGKLRKEQEAVIATNVKYCEDMAKHGASSASNATEDKDAKTGIKEKMDATSAVMQSYSVIGRTIGTTIPGMAFNAAVAVADMVDAGISNLKEEKKES